MCNIPFGVTLLCVISAIYLLVGSSAAYIDTNSLETTDDYEILYTTETIELDQNENEETTARIDVGTFGTGVNDPQRVNQTVDQDYSNAFSQILHYFNVSTSSNQKRIRGLKSENTVLRYNNTNLQQEVNQLEGQIQNLQLTNSDLNDRLSALESTLEQTVTIFDEKMQELNTRAENRQALNIVVHEFVANLQIEQMLANPKAQLYSGKNFTGVSEAYNYATAKYEGGCHDLVDLKGKVKSVETFGKCVRVFASRGCAGWSLAVYPGNGHSSDVLTSKLTEVSSIGPCLSNEFEGASFINETVLVGTPSVEDDVPNLVQFFNTEKFKRKTRNLFTLGPHGRVEFVRGTITPKQLMADQPLVDVEGNEYYQSLYTYTDDVVGYFHPTELGGPANENWNVFPQSPSGRDAWRRATSEIRPYLERTGSKWVDLVTNVMYEDDESTRPYAFYYLINYDSKRITYGHIPN